MKRTRWMSVWPTVMGVVLGAQAACAFLGGGAPPETPQQAAERVTLEETIRREVEARIAAEPAIGAGRIRAVVSGGDVQLHGTAPGFGALQCALTNAGLVHGVRLVVDMMVLQPGPARVSCLAPRVFGATAAAP